MKEPKNEKKEYIMKELKDEKLQQVTGGRGPETIDIEESDINANEEQREESLIYAHIPGTLPIKRSSRPRKKRRVNERPRSER